MQKYTVSLIGLSLSLLAAGCQPVRDSGHSNTPPQRANSDDLPPERAADACLATAHELDRNGYANEAINEYERARQLNPLLSTIISRRLAVLYDRCGNDSRALAEYQAALREFRDDSDFLNDYGFFYVARNNGAEAERWLRQAISTDPKSARAWVNLGTALAEQRRYDESYNAYCRVLPVAQAWSNVGTIEAQQGDYSLAVQSLTQASNADPSLAQTEITLRWARKKLVAASGDR